MKKKIFFDFFQFFWHLCNFCPNLHFLDLFHFSKGYQKGLKSTWPEKNWQKIDQWLYVLAHKILESQTQISRKKSKFVRGEIQFSNPDFSHQILKRRTYTFDAITVIH